jgi:hypothetical protein
MIDFNLNILKVNGKRVELLYPGVHIKKIAITDDNIIIAHLNINALSDDDENAYRNVFAVSMKGEILWQIEASDFSQKVGDKMQH